MVLVSRIGMLECLTGGGVAPLDRTHIALSHTGARHLGQVSSHMLQDGTDEYSAVKRLGQ
jgi:hypothetical protein